jgi:hypothetical protein
MKTAMTIFTIKHALLFGASFIRILFGQKGGYSGTGHGINLATINWAE